jgi:hypothetical protein
LEYLGVDWNILLNGSSRNKIGASGEDESGSEQGQVAGCCTYGNIISVSIKYAEFLD